MKRIRRIWIVKKHIPTENSTETEISVWEKLKQGNATYDGNAEIALRIRFVIPGTRSTVWFRKDNI